MVCFDDGSDHNCTAWGREGDGEYSSVQQVGEREGVHAHPGQRQLDRSETYVSGMARRKVIAVAKLPNAFQALRLSI